MKLFSIHQHTTPSKAVTYHNEVTAYTTNSANSGVGGAPSQEGSPFALTNQNLNTRINPKKPLSAYIYFSQEHREVLKKKHP